MTGVAIGVVEQHRRPFGPARLALFFGNDFMELEPGYFRILLYN